MSTARETLIEQQGPKPLCSVEHLRKYFPLRGHHRGPRPCVHAVDDVSFAIGKGQTLGLVGESGSGKSTLGRTVLSLMPATAGSVYVAGHTLFDTEKNTRLKGSPLSSARRDMQMIFQDPYASLNPRRTLGAAVLDGVHRHGIVPKKEERDYVCAMLQRCGLDASAFDRYPSEFSGGQRQRAVIARALALKPAFVVADEPTAALDVSIQSQILNLMLDMQDELGLTYLFISHNLGVVRTFCDEVAVMFLGRIVEKGPVDEVCANPAHPYTIALLESVPPDEPQDKPTHIDMIEGAVSAVDLPKGCRYAPRCPFAQADCLEHDPSLRPLASRASPLQPPASNPGDASPFAISDLPRHDVACWHPQHLSPLRNAENTASHTLEQQCSNARSCQSTRQ